MEKKEYRNLRKSGFSINIKWYVSGTCFVAFQVFLNEACKLYTVDIQMAWIHVENGKHLMDIPFLNRQRPR